MNKKIFSVLFVVLISLACLDYQKANENAFDKLNIQIKAERFDEIYEQSSTLLRDKISKKEFVERMIFAIKSLKEIDSMLNWQKPKNQDEFSRDYSIKDTTFRRIEKGEKSIGIFIYWTENFTLCGFETTETKVINACS